MLARTSQPPRHRPLSPGAYVMGYTDLPSVDRRTLGERLTDEYLHAPSLETSTRLRQWSSGELNRRLFEQAEKLRNNE